MHPAPDEEANWRGTFIGERAAGSPFRVDVPTLSPFATAVESGARSSVEPESDGEASAQAPPPPPKRACVASDLRDLSTAAMVAPDESALRLPVSRWRYEPRDCTLGKYRVSCSSVAECLSRGHVTLMGDSALERLRYAFAAALLPAAIIIAAPAGAASSRTMRTAAARC